MGIVDPSTVKYPEGGVIETASGALFDVKSPVFDIEDIAHALSMNCRYNGMCRHFYSVAEHSIIVSLLMENELKEGDPLEGLLHDAQEAYLTDVPAPIKQHLPDWKELDAGLELNLREHFGLPLDKSSACAEADWLALFIEASWLLHSKGSSAAFRDPYSLLPRAELLVQNGWRVLGQEPADIKAAFLRRYHALTNPNQAVV